MKIAHLAIFGTLLVVVSAQDSEKRFQINGVFYNQQCGDQPDLIANPRICFQSKLDINKEAIRGMGYYDGYSTSDGHHFSYICTSEYRRMYTKDYWISAIQGQADKANPNPCCVYSIRQRSDGKLMSAGSSCIHHNNVMHGFPAPL